ncbi:MAG: TIM barrel protein [Candidatus Pseudomonas colombiensis]|nr:MAG: TIM barrel protein [Pseudomonas sp.]
MVLQPSGPAFGGGRNRRHCQPRRTAETQRRLGAGLRRSGRLDPGFTGAPDRAPALSQRTGPWQDYADKLTELARFTLSQGVRLAYHHHMGAYVESPADIDKLMSLTGEEVGLLFDSGHCYMGGGEPLEVLRKHIQRVCHVHFKDVRKPVVQLARNNLWSFPDCIVNGTFTVPGDGDIDFAALLDVLLAADYHGWLVVEAEQDPAVAPSYVYAKKGYDTLRALLDAGLQRTRTAQ